VRRITEIKRTLTGRVDEFLCDVYSQSPDELIAIYRLPKARDLHGVWLPEGTMTAGYFWPARPYNLYHWVLPGQGTLAYYFNIGDVGRYDDNVIEWDDLAIDVLATPDGRMQVLDEYEIPADLAPRRREAILAARDEVLRDLPALIETAERTTALVFQDLPSR
jgi:hypothetical protein